MGCRHVATKDESEEVRRDVGVLIRLGLQLRVALLSPTTIDNFITDWTPQPSHLSRYPTIANKKNPTRLLLRGGNATVYRGGSFFS